MAEKMLTIRLSEQEHRALKLYAVLQGRSVNGVVTDLIRAELARHTGEGGGRDRAQFVAELLARFNIDPDSPEHQAAAARARESLQRAQDAGQAAGGRAAESGAA
jgi:hypothetical protein